MASTASSAQQSTLAIQSGTSFITIAQIENITGPGTTVDLIDITNLDSTGGYKEYFGGLKDNEAVSFDLVWNAADTGTGYFIAANTGATLSTWKVSFNFGTPKTATFSGYATKWSPKAAKGDVMRASGEVKPTGVITWE